MRICGFLKVRNEIIREGNIYRALRCLSEICDTIVACDDASVDGTRELLVATIPKDQLVLVPSEEQDFRHELRWKQRMLDIVHRIKPDWILWHDGDEVFERKGSGALFRDWLEHAEPHPAWSFHYTQFWRNTTWARTDDGFDAGYFVKLWRYDPSLSFHVIDATHAAQIPAQILSVREHVGLAPFDVLHYGNYGKSLVWKAIQYHGGLGGVDRHLVFPQGQYRRVDDQMIPEGVLVDPGDAPQPFSAREIEIIRSLQNLRHLPAWFTVIIPTYNRAYALPAALNSVLEQTYPNWVAVVLDDGSTDNTESIMRHYQRVDPRIFYCRYPTNRGGVAMNEIGMDLAVEFTEYWTRLGSDDRFLPHKLARDAEVLRHHEAVYAPYGVYRNGKAGECGNPYMTPEVIRERLLSGSYEVSWANCAARTDVLRRVKARYGTYVDPRLRNMEDFVFNARVVRNGVQWIWRPSPEGYDAIWTVAHDGASSNADVTTRDQHLSIDIIRREGM